jgi:hypothetical protein
MKKASDMGIVRLGGTDKDGWIAMNDDFVTKF